MAFSSSEKHGVHQCLGVSAIVLHQKLHECTVITRCIVKKKCSASVNLHWQTIDLVMPAFLGSDDYYTSWFVASE